MSKGFASNYRIVVLAALVLLSFAGLGTRLYWLHVVDRSELLGYVEKARRQVIVESGRRGDILDDRGNLLATSRSLIVLGVDPQAVRSQDKAKWPQLAALIGVPLDRLETLLTTKFRPAAAAAAARSDGDGTEGRAPEPKPVNLVFNLGPAPAAKAAAPAGGPVQDDTVLDEPDEQGNRPIRWAKLSDEVSESVYAEVQKLGVRGVYGTRVYRRDYPHNELAAHIIGYVDREGAPVAGMEHFANFYLQAQDGWVESEKDGRREELAQFRTREVPPGNGYSVVLSIDAPVQHIVEAELADIAKRFQPTKATIIVSDPRTGFILALANYPSFNLNAYNEVAPQDQGCLRNIAVTDQYEPGSVFKIVAIAGALNDGLVTPASTFDCTAATAVGRDGVTRPLPREDQSDHFDHPLTVAEITSRSSNKGAAQLGMLLGDQRFYEYARAFGFGQRTGFPFGGEVAGTMAPPDKWDGLTITRMPIGQSVAATPLQMTQAMEVIASGGLLLRPRVIREVRDDQGTTVFSFDRPEVVRRVISESTARTMARLLMGVASKDGTAPEAAVPGYDVAGKTGTAQKLMPELTSSGRTVLRYSEHHHVASFIGFFPASQPQVVISVIVDDADAHTPGGVAYGAMVAAPAFHHIAEQLITIPELDIRPPVETAPPVFFALEGGRR